MHPAAMPDGVEVVLASQHGNPLILKRGDDVFIKALVGHEWMWTQRIKVTADDRYVGRIDSRPSDTHHGYREGDVVEFCVVANDDGSEYFAPVKRERPKLTVVA